MSYNVATNRWAVSNYIVAPTIVQGARYTSIASAIAAASAAGGGTVTLKPGIYTENFTMVPNVNLCALGGDWLIPTVTIKGKISFSTAGTYCIYGINLRTNADYSISITGTNAITLNLLECYLDCPDHDAILNSNSNSSTIVNLDSTDGNLSTTGIHYWNWSCPGSLSTFGGSLINSGVSNAGGTFSAGTFNSLFTNFACKVDFSTASNCSIQNGNFNATALSGAPVNTTGAGNTSVLNTHMACGSNAAMNVGPGAFGGVRLCPINSTATYVFTGTGQINYANNTFTNSSAVDPGLTSAFAETGPVVRVGDGGSVIFNTTAGIIGAQGAQDLNQFEYGTWTPTVDGSTTSPTVTYNFQLGWYTKINKRLFLNFHLGINTFSGGTGNLLIKGAPYNNTITSNYKACGSVLTDTVTLGSNLYYVLAANTSNKNILIQGVVSASGSPIVPITGLAAGVTLRGEIQFITDD